MKTLYIAITVLLFNISYAQFIEVKQDDDNVLFTNNTDNTVEMWLRMQSIAVNILIEPHKTKRYKNLHHLVREDFDDSEIYYAYTFTALEHDVKKITNEFEKRLKEKRKRTNYGHELINQPFYRTQTFYDFLRNEETIKQWRKMNAADLNNYTNSFIVPKSKNLLSDVKNVSSNHRESVLKMVEKFLAKTMIDSSEKSLFLNHMNEIETLFQRYNSTNNQKVSLGNLKENDFKLFKNNPSTDFGVYITTNNTDLITKFDTRAMDTRGFNFEVYFAQRFAKSRIAKRRTMNFYGAMSYLSYKDKLNDLKKSFINVGPEIRYTGYYENQVQLIASAGITADITSEKYITDLDKRQFGFYGGGEISLLFIRLGARYYTNLANKELMPEGNWFYRFGLVGKF